ncbi:hypothetical protein [Nostoc sp.]|uniref:hypothetical protein n=1 Tax=Nostoc sp. TaxID=1180 RepID=UPI002FFCD2A3
MSIGNIAMLMKNIAILMRIQSTLAVSIQTRYDIISRGVGHGTVHWCQFKLKAFSNLVSSVWAGNATLGGRAASKGGGASRTAFPVGDWERDKVQNLYIRHTKNLLHKCFLQEGGKGFG